jgi:uroporphyrin-III C-methyltransferase
MLRFEDEKWSLFVTRVVSLPGTVFLTGAGPGSVKLLTLRALEVLRIADVVFHDDLVSEEVLALIPSHVGVQSVGKRCGFKKISQEEIQQRVIRAARSGQTVVRLKGGDPLIFARAQEEIAALREEGIPFEIVPGVTVACAAAAEAQIALTDRKIASKLVFISNHQCAEKTTRLWPNTFEDSTLVFYMPGGEFASLQNELLENGMDSEIPCVVISRAARQAQEVIRTTIRGLAALPWVAAPSILIVGATGAEARADLHIGGGQREEARTREKIVLEFVQSPGTVST